MLKKDFILKCIINNPREDREYLGDLYIKLQEEGVIAKPKAKTDIVKKQSLQDIFKENVLWDEKFILRLIETYSLTKDFLTQEMNKFLAYRTEKSPNARKERWEKQKVFEIQRRFTTWIDNNKLN